MALDEGVAVAESALVTLQQRAAEAERLLAQQPVEERSQIACAAGCSSCCVVNVSTLLPEGIAIQRYLQRYPEAQQQAIVTRLESLWQTVRGLDDEERLVVRRRCAFLDPQGRCQIYAVRPLLCRSLTSTSAESCRDTLTGAVFGEETPILMHQYQQQLYESIFTNLAGQLERWGIDGRSFQLTGLVRFLLQHPGAESELLNGRRLDWQDLY